MSAVQSMRMFVCERLTTAAEEIFGLFERKIEDYEKEIDRQRRILDAVLNPEVRLRRVELHHCSTTIAVVPQDAVKQEQTEACVVRGRPQTPRQRDPDGCGPTRVEEERVSRNTDATQFQNGPSDPPAGFLDEHEAFRPDRKKLPASEHTGDHQVGSQSFSAGRHCPIADVFLPTSIKRTPDGEECRNDSITRREKLVTENKSIDDDLDYAEVMPAARLKCGSSASDSEPTLNEDDASTGEQIPDAKGPRSGSSDTNSESDGKATPVSNATSAGVKTRVSLSEKGGVSGATTPAGAEEPRMRKRRNHESSATDGRIDWRDKDVDPTGDPGPTQRDGHNSERSRSHRSVRSRSDGEASAPSSDHPYRCDSCEKVMSNVRNYKFHMRSHTFEKTFKCDACGQTFRDRSSLNKHRLVHSEVKPFQCGVCQKGFTRRFNLELHGRVHTGEKPFVCAACGKTLSSNANRKRHTRVHTAEKPYACRGCGKAFADSSGFKNHLRVHSGEKPFRCGVCHRRFATGTTLKRHGRTHSGEKPYKCAVCQKAFGLKSILNSHARTHTGKTPYPCGSCGQKFSTWLKVSRHESTRHKTP